MLKFILPVVIIGLVLASSVGFLLYQRQTSVKVKQTSIQASPSVTESIPSETQSSPLEVQPPLANSAEDSVIISRLNDLAKQVTQVMGMNTKVDNLEKQIDDLNTRLTKLEGGTVSLSPSATPTPATGQVTGPMYLYALGYGGSTTSTDWTEISTLKFTFDPSLYPGYKSLQLESYMRVRDGNGKASARLYSSGTPATASEVFSTNYQDEWVSSGTFTWNSKATFTIQLKSLTGYEAYLSNARIKINF